MRTWMKLLHNRNRKSKRSRSRWMENHKDNMEMLSKILCRIQIKKPEKILDCLPLLKNFMRSNKPDSRFSLKPKSKSKSSQSSKNKIWLNSRLKNNYSNRKIKQFPSRNLKYRNSKFHLIRLASLISETWTLSNLKIQLSIYSLKQLKPKPMLLNHC